MHTLILSDLHLTPERPEVIAAFLHFLSTQAPAAERIYILGDLFEYWIGDDAAPLIGADVVLAAMKTVSAQVDCYFIAGNRDFLVGQQFSLDSGFVILEDETVVDLYGTPVLLLHGDSMCTDDIAHMQFRQEIVTNQTRRAEFLALPITDRIQQAQQARIESNKHKSNISMEIMDVNAETVVKTFRDHHVTTMIHGHTHRQNTHCYEIDGDSCTRYVLGDWADTSSIMTVSPSSIEIVNTSI